jgi:hypothetical protein
MAKFASQTTVPVEKSRAEVERELVRFGASGFTSGWQENRALIEFVYKSKKIRFVLELPPHIEQALLTQVSPQRLLGAGL